MRPTRRLAWASWVSVCLIWGTTYLGIRIALETMPPLLMAGMRWTIAGALVAAALAARRTPLPATRQWPGLALLAVLMIVLGNGMVVWAELYVPSGLTAVVVATSPFWMVAVESRLRGGERLTWGTTAGLIVGFSGIVLLVWPNLRAEGVGDGGFLAGVGALQIACLGWALGSSWSKRHATEENVFAATALQMLLGGTVMTAAGTAFGEWDSLSFSPRTAVAFAYLILVGSIGGFIAYIYALRHLPVSIVSLYAYINPVIAVVLGALVLGEPFTPRIVAAAALVLAGLALVRLSSAKTERSIAGARARAEPIPGSERDRSVDSAEM
jgi:drug/metabolite transporter (DMT)-like permease